MYVSDSAFWPRDCPHANMHELTSLVSSACHQYVYHSSSKCPIVYSLRFLRHVPVIYVDYPGPLSLKQIYGTFNRAMLRLVPNLRAYAEPLTEAMVDFYTMSQVKNMGSVLGIKAVCACMSLLDTASTILQLQRAASTIQFVIASESPEHCYIRLV